MNRRDFFRLAAASIVAPLAPVLPKTIVLPFTYGKAKRMEPIEMDFYDWPTLEQMEVLPREFPVESFDEDWST